MSDPLCIVHVEDSQDDVELVARLLQREGFEPEMHRVETRSDLIDVLSRTECDVILADYTVPGFGGIQALEIAHSLKPGVPFIFLSGTISEETAVETLRNGAVDYVLKDRPARLVPAIRRALAEAKEKSFHDVLERRLHEALRLQAVGHLAGGVARDITRVLTKIKTQATALAEKCQQVAGASEGFDVLVKTADEGTNAMQQLLAFARRSGTQLSRIDPVEKLAEIADGLKATLPVTIKLAIRHASSVPPILADPEHLRRIITNLVLNAKDAMPNGGYLTISTEVVQFDPVPSYLSELEASPYLQIKVGDTGPGMDEATKQRVFEPFFTTKALGDGPGLGLSEVLGLMRMQHGMVDVQSGLGHGTEVSLFFPLAPEESTIRKTTKIPPIQMPETIFHSS